MTLISINSWQYDVYTFNIFVHVTVGIRCQSQPVTIPAGGLVLCENTCTMFVDLLTLLIGLWFVKDVTGITVIYNTWSPFVIQYCILNFPFVYWSFCHWSCHVYIKISFIYGRGFLKHIADSNPARACVSLMLFCVGQMKNEVDGDYPSYRFIT